MLASLGIATCVVDAAAPDLPLTYVNPAFEALTGYAADEVLGRNCRFLQGERTDPGTVARIRSALAKGEGCRVTLLNLRRDGTPFENELTITPVPGPGGEVTGYIGALVDVTGRAIEDELRYRSLVEQIQAITYVADWAPEAPLRFVSPQIEGLLGFPPEAWIADQGLWAARLHPEDRERVLAGERRAHADEVGLDAEYRMIAADGAVVWFWERAAIVRDAAGRPRTPRA